MSARAMAALVRLDLRASGRSLLGTSARGVALAGSGGLGLAAWLTVASGTRASDVASWGLAAIFIGLGAAAALLGPAFAVRALGQERERGTLDVLRLAGLSPAALAASRTLSTTLAFASLLAAALPGACLFWYFRATSPAHVGLAALVLLSFDAALAACLVAISAVTRTAAAAAAAALLAVSAWAAFSVIAPAAVGELSLPSLVAWLLGVEGSAAPALGEAALRCLPIVSFHAAVTAAGVGLAALALVRAERRAPERALPVAPQSRPGARAPLTWLARRRSPLLRPRVQLVVTVALVLAATAAVVGTSRQAPSAGPWRDLGLVLGHVLVALGCILSLTAGALEVAGHRAHDAWHAVLSTRATGREIVADLVRCAILAGAVPAIAGTLLVTCVHDWSGDGGRGLAFLLVLPIAWISSAVQGVGASLRARGTAGALGLALFGQALVPALIETPRALGGLGLFALLVLFVLAAQRLVRIAWGRELSSPMIPACVIAGAVVSIAGSGSPPAGVIGVLWAGARDALVSPPLPVLETVRPLALASALVLFLVAWPAWSQADRLLGRAA